MCRDFERENEVQAKEGKRESLQGQRGETALIVMSSRKKASSCERGRKRNVRIHSQRVLRRNECSFFPEWKIPSQNVF